MEVKTKELLNLSAQIGDFANMKIEVSNLEAEVLALKSIIEAKQEVVVNLEVCTPLILPFILIFLIGPQNERKERLAVHAELEQERQITSAKLSQLRSELAEKFQAVDEVTNLKNVCTKLGVGYF